MKNFVEGPSDIRTAFLFPRKILSRTSAAGTARAVSSAAPPPLSNHRPRGRRRRVARSVAPGPPRATRHSVVCELRVCVFVLVVAVRSPPPPLIDTTYSRNLRAVDFKLFLHRIGPGQACSLSATITGQLTTDMFYFNNILLRYTCYCNYFDRKS